jgi:hypothetical protein
VVPPMAHLRAATLEALERFAAAGGKVLGVLLAPSTAFGATGMEQVEDRVEALLGAPRGEVAAGRAAGEAVGATWAGPTGAPAGPDAAAAGAGRAGEADHFALSRREHPGGGVGIFLAGDRSVLTEGPGAKRDAFAAALREGIGSLIDPDVEISNDEVFCLHRRRDGRDLYFLVNPTFERQRMRVRLPGRLAPALWDPSSGDQRPAAATVEGAWTAFDLTLPPVGSVFVVTGGDAGPPAPAEDAAGSAPAPGAAAAPPPDPGAVAAELDRPWTFTAEDDNALVATGWVATPERAGEGPEAYYAGLEVDEQGWQPVVAGAWAYQLPVEPADAWPVPVWYRVGFEVQDLPERLVLLVDGFDGDDPRVWLNGRQVPWAPARSRIDAQMKELDLAGFARRGRNVLAVRLVLREPTGGLVDHVKLLGSFALAGDAERGWRIAARPDGPAQPEDWTGQGYPFYSGRGLYSTTVELPEELAGRRLLLEVPMRDDVLEVRVNGRQAGVRLWDPYVVEVTGLLRPGHNQLALRVSNTPANLLNATPRPSGLAGRPRLLEAAG